MISGMNEERQSRKSFGIRAENYFFSRNERSYSDSLEPYWPGLHSQHPTKNSREPIIAAASKTHQKICVMVSPFYGLHEFPSERQEVLAGISRALLQQLRVAGQAKASFLARPFSSPASEGRRL